MEFKLRPFEKNDLPSLVKYGNNPAIAKNMTDKFPHPYTEAAAESFIKYATSRKPAHIFAIEVGGEAAGGIGIHPQEDVHCKNAELGYWLGEPFWGKGIVPRAIKEMLDYSFNTFEINRIYARPYGSNSASHKVLEKAGFVLEARFEKTIFKNGVYLDELIYAVRRKN